MACVYDERVCDIKTTAYDNDNHDNDYDRRFVITEVTQVPRRYSLAMV